MKLCSACLLGINCRYDGKSKANRKVLKLAKKEFLIPICPEQLGGLGTPRNQSEIQKNGKVLDNKKKNLTKNFKLGAKEVLKIAKMFKIKEAILKQKSPSCGYGKIYDGSFSGKIINGNGITARLLAKNGIKVIADDNL